jgi:hypothetical protein
VSADERIWTVEGDPETGEVDQETLAAELLGLVPVLTRLGGAVQIMARRQHDDNGLYYTERVHIGWTLHAPLPRKRRQEPQDQSQAQEERPAPEPVGALNGAEESEPSFEG